MLGDYKYNYDIVNLGIDINSPITHVNSNECRKCQYKIDPVTLFNDLEHDKKHLEKIGDSDIFENCTS